MTFFVNQKKHNASTDAWDNNCHAKDDEYQALHQFHAFMSTYGYGFSENIDFVSCSVEAMDGRIVKNEVDNRIGTIQPETEE